ncbi:MAG: serpin family protein [Candidatus Eisenbacteria bacterium]
MGRGIRTFGLFFSVFMLIALAGCGRDSLCPQSDEEHSGDPLSQEILVSANNDFAFRLFKEIVKAQSDSNIFISPLSVSMALGMTMNGAGGSTLDSMLMTLGFPGYSTESADQCYRDLIDLLTGLDPEVLFEIANSIWGRSGVIFEAPFLEACRTCFDAEVSSLDFDQPDASDIINGWVDEKTHGKITEIVPKPIDPATMIILVNAIYFLGNWQYQFDPADTKDDWFHPPNEPKTPCRMMSRPQFPPPSDVTELLADYSVVLNDHFQAVDLPYGDSLFTMTLLLPRHGQDVDEIISWLNPDRWDSLTSSFHTCRGVLLMPRFELKYNLVMNDVLTALGMGEAFGDADFSEMCRSMALQITAVRHKTYVRVNEVGTEAAAVTEVECGPTSVPPECSSFTIKVDHPFMFVIRERYTNTILFVGRVLNPGYFAEG